MTKVPMNIPITQVVFFFICVDLIGDNTVSLDGIFDSKEKAEKHKEKLETDPFNATGLKHRYFYFEVKEVEVQ